MSRTVQELVDEIVPKQTVLILGAGASVPSNAPTSGTLIKKIADEFHIDSAGLSLSEIAGLAERKRNRRDLIDAVRSQFKGLRAKGALLNLPHYGWKAIYSTNYDELVEEAYSRAKRPLQVYSSNFDFTGQSELGATNLFKIHGTIGKDLVDGHVSRMILTDLDYDATQEYREALYDRLKSDMSPGAQVLIVGQSLADEDVREVVKRAILISQKAAFGGRITLLLYEKDENRAQLFESRGLRVAFGGLDDLVHALAKKAPDHVTVRNDTGNPLDIVTGLRPVTTFVDEELDVSSANAAAIFNGWAAKYADIVKGLTFDRVVAGSISQFLLQDAKLFAVLLGASGVGKTSAARQALLKLRGNGHLTFEHKVDHPLSSRHWCGVALELKASGKKGVLFIDDAHIHLFEVNELVDALVADGHKTLKLLVVSARNHWGPRVKSPHIYAFGKEFVLSQLNELEIDRLITLVDTIPELRQLVETGFSGFSRYEKKRRLVDRCEADMFVCLKNIFASEKFDDIILREYGQLSTENQEIYKHVAAMEHAGIRVHRQLVLRILGMKANAVAAVLTNLEDIVHEYDIEPSDGIYGWRVRHGVIAEIVSRYKFHDIDRRIQLFSRVIDNISPTYPVEIRTIRELCNMESGLSVIPNKQTQNTLLRRMMSIAPGERIPRHRLIRNLIDLGDFETAESEIRIFEKDFRREAPIARYRILLMIARATNTPGLLQEDRVVILQEARQIALHSAERYESNKYVLGAYCELGVETFKLTGSMEAFDEAMSLLKKAEVRLGDPDVTKMIVRYQRRLSGQSGSTDETSSDPSGTDV